MTQEEQKSVQFLNQTLGEIRLENKKFREELVELTNKLAKRVDEKHVPINLEGDIMQVVQASLHKAIGDSLGGYNSPLLALVKSVVESRSTMLREIISSLSFDNVISLPEFKASIVTAFSHKVAKTIISNNDGLFDKVSNELKQDAIFKSKMQIAVSNVVNECIAGK